MTISLTEDELRMELEFNRKPLSQIQETANEWLLGTWTLAKSHRTWRVGYAHPLVAGAAFRTFPFDIDGKRGVAVFFESAGEPPWIFAGWVEPERATEAAAWADFLNSEIANRLADLPAGKNPTYDPHDGKLSQDIEDEIAERKFANSLGRKPYRPT
ncbi:MAG: hypothetical protein JWP01_1750 [Myxococcales bacterium]|nr:hypothetical protein [Myxococcales bacterium]